jgi:hypothetical protein
VNIRIALREQIRTMLGAVDSSLGKACVSVDGKELGQEDTCKSLLLENNAIMAAFNSAMRIEALRWFRT